MAKGYDIVSSRAGDEWSGIVALTHPKHDLKQLQRELMRLKIVPALREGRLRISPHFYNSPEQIQRFIDALPL